LDVVRLPVIAGPTGAGKSAIALALAERFPVAVVSVDSRQIYRGFDVGTAKPSAAERALAPHYGVDVVEPTERYSASAWAEAVPGWLAAARASGRTPLLVGGTGFYLRALFEPFFESPPLDPARRAALEAELARVPTPELRRWCQQLDPARAHLGRTQLLRAVETALLTGARLSDLQARRRRPPRHAPRYLLVDPGRPLAERLAERTRTMVRDGWLAEVEALAANVPADAPAWSATGYDVLRRVVAGDLPLERAVPEIVIATRQYAKRQRTWFRHQLGDAPVTRLDPGAPDAADRAVAWWRGERETP
jgi:tRNA dimethylallyltransferase